MKKILSIIAACSIASTSAIVSNASYKMELVTNITNDVPALNYQIAPEEINVISINQLSLMIPEEITALTASIDSEVLLSDCSELLDLCFRYVETVLNDQVVKKIMKRHRNGDKINQAQKRHLAKIFYDNFLNGDEGFRLKINSRTILDFSEGLPFKEQFVESCVDDEELFKDLLSILVKIYSGESTTIIDYLNFLSTCSNDGPKESSNGDGPNFWDFLSAQQSMPTRKFFNCCCTLL